MDTLEPEENDKEEKAVIKVTCEVQDYSDPEKPSILVHSDWCSKQRVVIEVDGTRKTVYGYDLIEAIRNCMNTNG